jgi:hypothetical protein
VAVQQSTDGGDTWSSPTLIAALLTVGVADPNNVDPRTNKPPAPLRTGDILPMPAVDAHTGDLYVVWQDSRFSGQDEIVISTLDKSDATWTAPKRVSTPNGRPAFTAAVAVSSSGQIGVTYYQLGTTAPGSMPTDYVIKKFSRAALLSGAANSIDTRVSGVTLVSRFNMLDAPFASGYFTGDYEALATSARASCQSSSGHLRQHADVSSLTSVTRPADITPTGNNSTDVFSAAASNWIGPVTWRGDKQRRLRSWRSPPVKRRPPAASAVPARSLRPGTIGSRRRSRTDPSRSQPRSPAVPASQAALPHARWEWFAGQHPRSRRPCSDPRFAMASSGSRQGGVDPGPASLSSVREVMQACV